MYCSKPQCPRIFQRPKCLTSISNALSSVQNAVVVQGPNGVGKTAGVASLIQTLDSSTFLPNNVHWFDARDNSLHFFFGIFVRRYTQTTCDDNQAAEIMRTNAILLVIDHAELATQADLMTLCGIQRQGSKLLFITSQNIPCLANFEIIQYEPLNSEECIALYQLHAGSATDICDFQSIVTLLHGLPYLVNIVSQILKSATSPYLTELQLREVKCHRVCPSVFQKLQRAVDDLDEVTRKVLKVCQLLANAPFQVVIVAAAVDPGINFSNVEASLNKLVDYCLLQQVAESTFQICHAIVLDSIRVEIPQPDYIEVNLWIYFADSLIHNRSESTMAAIIPHVKKLLSELSLAKPVETLVADAMTQVLALSLPYMQMRLAMIQAVLPHCARADLRTCFDFILLSLYRRMDRMEDATEVFLDYILLLMCWILFN